MTNQQIIEDVVTSMYGPDAVAAMISDFGEIPYHTALGWRLRGPYKIKEGEKGIETRLWKKRKRASDLGTGEPTDQKEAFYLSKAYLFSWDQVERVDR